MLKKMRELAVSAYVKTNSFLHDLKNDERGLTGIVVTVLLILVAVLLALLIYGLITGWITDTLWPAITGGKGGGLFDD